MSAQSETAAAGALGEALRRSRRLHGRLWGVDGEAAIADLGRRTRLGPALAALAGRSVLVRVRDPFQAALALVELDGVAGRIVLCPPDLAPEHLGGVIGAAEADWVVSDAPALRIDGLGFAPIASQDAPRVFSGPLRPSEWVMFTSGTAGAPKLVVHTLAGLSGAIRPQSSGEAVVWATFYDIRRYGGLQILLRALLGGASMVISHPDEPLAELLGRCSRHNATHITGTPSHWRRLSMSPAAAALAPRYLRLSGEIADQQVLDGLKARFPGVPIGHAYASTEAGVAFEVVDGREGFPASILGERRGGVEVRIVDGALQVRSDRTAARYLGADAPRLRDPEGYVDTGDIVQLVGAGRYHFIGRRSGVINVGGLKTHPEEIEAAINRHPLVRMSRASARRNPITGAVVRAEVVLMDGALAQDPAVKTDILAHCRRALAPHKAPASISFVPALPISAGGKLERPLA